MINRVAGKEQEAQDILDSFSKSSTGGFLLGGLPDISNPEAVRRHDYIGKIFSAEQNNVDNKRIELIRQGRAAGDNAQQILGDVVALYDSQSDLFRTGIGWNGAVFAFDASSPQGYQQTLNHSRDVVDVQV